MHIKGTLSKWNDDRGFGFISPIQGGQDVFVHISAFPKDGIQPTLGETLIFEIETDTRGKKRARNLLCPKRPAVNYQPSSRRTASYHRKEKPGFPGRIIPLLIFVGLGIYGYNKFSHRTTLLSPAIVTTQNIQETTSSYQCDGRIYCSQMTSCAEATFFLQNCPDVRMDGNNDGVPCEQQWCTNPF